VLRAVKLPRRLLLVLATTTALVLSGCAAGQISQTADQVAAIDGANGTAGPIGVRDVRLASSSDNSWPAGSDIPVKMWLTNSSLSADTLTSATSPGAASVTIEGKGVVNAQSLLEITEDTDLTVTVSGLKEELQTGHSLPVTFVFEVAGSITVNVPIEIPAERADDDRPTVDILPAEPTNIWSGEEHVGAEETAAEMTETTR
jgi:copper(I)-binding protein